MNRLSFTRTKQINLQVYYTDSTFFNLFSFDLAAGDKKSCLESPQGIVITQRAVKKIFGSENPLGKEVLINGRTFTVTAVAKDPPVNTNMQFDCLASLPKLIKDQKYPPNWEGGLTCYTYLKLIKGADYRLLEKQILEYMEGVVNKKYREFGYAVIPYLQKISEIHLDSKTDYDMGDKGNRGRVYIFSGIGLADIIDCMLQFCKYKYRPLLPEGKGGFSEENIRVRQKEYYPVLYNGIGNCNNHFTFTGFPAGKNFAARSSRYDR